MCAFSSRCSLPTLAPVSSFRRACLSFASSTFAEPCFLSEALFVHGFLIGVAAALSERRAVSDKEVEFPSTDNRIHNQTAEKATGTRLPFVHQ